jgi:uncharacterized protein
MAAYEYSIEDFEFVVAGAAVFCSGGGGSYQDALTVLGQLRSSWSGSVPVQDYDGATACSVMAMMGSPDAGAKLTLDDIYYSISNTTGALSELVGPLGCAIAVEVGPINSLVPLLAATRQGGSITWVVNGDGAGRSVPDLPQTTYGGAANLSVSPTALGNDADGVSAPIQTTIVNAPTSDLVETIAGSVLTAFGSFGGIAAWPSYSGNGYALEGNYIPGTLEQARQLGIFLSSAPQTTANVANQIFEITGRTPSIVFSNFYITQVSQHTNASLLDAGIIQLDNNPDPKLSTETYYLYNQNESLILYSKQSNQPCVVAPDSICYYSEDTGAGFSNATNDLAVYYDFTTNKSTGNRVSVIGITAAPMLNQAPGVRESFAETLRSIGYAGALPQA